MFLRWGAAYSRAHLISACRVALVCGLSLALSLPLALPHGLARLVLCEQLYRAASVLKNHPYHREG